jgi:hypothetical protein
VVRAQLALDSDLPPDPQLFLDAGEHAMRMLDVELAERFAEAAASADPAAAARCRRTASWPPAVARRPTSSWPTCGPPMTPSAGSGR